MLISPPFLPPRGADQNDADWLAVAMCSVASSELPGSANTEIAGSYPVSLAMGWHGGSHLVAPVANNIGSPVCAIAEGTVVYARSPKEEIRKTATDPLNYGANEGDSCNTNDGVVLIKHKTDFGANASGQVVELVFYSLYMHLNELDKIRPNPQAALRPLRTGDQVKRKDKLGRAGYIYGQPHRLHFEIFCDDANLQLLAGRVSGDLPIDRDGRSDVVFGELYFLLPDGTPVYGERPPANQATPTANAAYSTTETLIIGLSYDQVDLNGQATLTTCRLDGTRVDQPLVENQANYALYESACAIVEAYPENARPAQSAVYELLRFGRVLGPTALMPADVPHWRQVRYPGGQGWANLNAANVRKFSDADFPHWKGWRFIDDSADQDSRCDSPTIRGWFDRNRDGVVDAAEPGEGTRDQALLRKLEHTLCKFPIEWKASTLDTRWGWLKSKSLEVSEPLSDNDFNAFKAHGEALCFWEKITAQDSALPDNPWRFHPRRFIQMFRTFCIWPDLIRRWHEAEAGHRLPEDDGLSLFAKTALYEYGLRSSLAATRNHQNAVDYAAFRALDQRDAVIFGMRVHTDVNASQGRGDWDDRVTLLKRDETGLAENIYRGRYTTEPSGRYLHGGPHGVNPQGENVGGSYHRDVGRLISGRSYQYAPNGNPSVVRFGALRFGGNQFNILRKTASSHVERMVTTNANVTNGTIGENNAAWQTGTTAGYFESQTMHFHKGYTTTVNGQQTGLTGSAGCQTFPATGHDRFDDFMNKLEPMAAASRFQYALKEM